jgi:putative hydrolase of the HAD superfamily
MLLFFDFDETIAFREGKFSKAIHELLLANNYNNVSMETIKSYLQSGFPWHFPEKSHFELFGNRTWNQYMNDFFFNVLLSIGINKTKSYELSNQVISQYINPNYWFVYPDVVPFMESISNFNFESYILSNHVPNLSDLIAGLGISKYFKGIFSSGNMKYEKPHVEFFKHVLNTIQVNTKDVIMIGDSYNADIKGAKTVGIPAILVRSENKNNYQPYVKDFSDLLKCVSELQLTTAST